MKIIVICAIAALMLAAVSCTEQPHASAKTNTASIDPCKLLTQDEAAAAINEQVGAAKRENNNPDLLCSYANDATGHSVSVTSVIGKTAKQEFKRADNIVSHDMVVNDLGDSAFISKTRAIYVITGRSYFSIKIKDDSPQALPKTEGVRQPPGSTELPQATRDKLIALARKAVDRL